MCLEVNCLNVKQIYKNDFHHAYDLMPQVDIFAAVVVYYFFGNLDFLSCINEFYILRLVVTSRDR